MSLRRFATASLCAWLLLSPGISAHAHELRCLPRIEAMEVLRDHLEQQPLLNGSGRDGSVMELFVTADRNQWTVVLTDPDHPDGDMTCRAMTGFKLRPGPADLGVRQ